jgi:hypothetical protein
MDAQVAASDPSRHISLGKGDAELRVKEAEARWRDKVLLSNLEKKLSVLRIDYMDYIHASIQQTTTGSGFRMG